MDKPFKRRKDSEAHFLISCTYISSAAHQLSKDKLPMDSIIQMLWLVFGLQSGRMVERKVSLGICYMASYNDLPFLALLGSQRQ